MICNVGMRRASVPKVAPPKLGLVGWYKADSIAGTDGAAVTAWPR